MLMIIVMFFSTSIPGNAIFFGYDFEYQGKSNEQWEDWFHILDNRSSASMSSTKTVSRQKIANCSTSVQVSLTGLTGNLSGSLEVSIGTSTTVTWTTTFNANPWTKVRCS